MRKRKADTGIVVEDVATLPTTSRIDSLAHPTCG
jgi:hypothetical protein